MAIQRSSFRWNGAAVDDAVKDAIMKGLNHGAEHLLQVSGELVPLDEGTLERSGTVSDDPGELTVAVSYDTPYAVDQHEMLEIRHAEGRQAKYLEQPMTTEADTIKAIVRQKVKRELA